MDFSGHNYINARLHCAPWPQMYRAPKLFVRRRPRADNNSKHMNTHANIPDANVILFHTHGTHGCAAR